MLAIRIKAEAAAGAARASTATRARQNRARVDGQRLGTRQCDPYPSPRARVPTSRARAAARSAAAPAGQSRRASAVCCEWRLWLWWRMPLVPARQPPTALRLDAGPRGELGIGAERAR
jgi:hypothetical protein